MRGEGGDGVDDFDSHLAHLIGEVGDAVRAGGHVGAAGVRGGHGDAGEIAVGLRVIEKFGEGGNVRGVEADDACLQWLKGFSGMRGREIGRRQGERGDEVGESNAHPHPFAGDGPDDPWRVTLREGAPRWGRAGPEWGSVALGENAPVAKSQGVTHGAHALKVDGADLLLLSGFSFGGVGLSRGLCEFDEGLGHAFPDCGEFRDFVWRLIGEINVFGAVIGFLIRLLNSVQFPWLVLA